MKKVYLSFCLLLLVGYSSCKKADLEKPLILSATLNGISEEVYVAAGTTLLFDGTFKDNLNLGEYKIDIHDDFDLHDHGKTNANSRFSLQQISEISGTQVTVQDNIPLPSNASAGPYHCIIRVLDAEGNEGDFAEIPFSITQATQPVITVLSPDLNLDNPIARGATLSLTGQITDNSDLTEIRILFQESTGHAHNKTGANPLYEEVFTLGGVVDTTWNFSELATLNQPIEIPANAPLGAYILIIAARDDEDNLTVAEGLFDVE